MTYGIIFTETPPLRRFPAPVGSFFGIVLVMDDTMTEAITFPKPLPRYARVFLRRRDVGQDAGRWIAWRKVRWTLFGAIAVAISLQTYQVFFGLNFHNVIPGEVYRCAQPSPADLRTIVRDKGIRTVINLRGHCMPNAFYVDETRGARDLNLNMEDIRLSAGRLPPVPEIRRIVEVLDRSDYPLLIHCRRGSDRTGLVSALAVLLKTDVRLDEGIQQLGLRFGHVAIGRPGYLDQFFDLYKSWLAEEGLAHSRAVFRRWLEREYVPGHCRCRIEPLELPDRMPCGAVNSIRVRFHNTSRGPWNFCPGINAGIHAKGLILDDRGKVAGDVVAGLFEACVRPGESIDLTIGLPVVERPGRYRLALDLNDARQCLFRQTGSEPLEREIEFQ